MYVCFLSMDHILSVARNRINVTLLYSSGNQKILTGRYVFYFHYFEKICHLFVDDL